MFMEIDMALGFGTTKMVGFGIKQPMIWVKK
jgi:hypothetical protein